MVIRIDERLILSLTNVVFYSMGQTVGANVWWFLSETVLKARDISTAEMV